MIPCFSADGKWSQAPHPMGDEEGDYNDLLAKAGYESWNSWGSALQTSLDVYHRPADDSYFVSLNTPSFFAEVMCENTIAFLEFMRLYGQMWIEIAFKQDVSDLLEELRNLLIDRDCGVFRDEVRTVERRRADLRAHYRKTAAS